MAQVDYPATLAEAWAQHKAPREDNAPTVISTFAGCGGSSLGYSMAGYREVLAVEWDDNAVATFRLNFPEVPVYHGDIAKLTVEECMSLAGLSGPRELDVLDGSPPCQGFSTAGKREIDDDRNQLFREFVRLLRGLQPRVFIMENVSGMVKGKMKLIFAEVMRELRASGYKVSCRLMNAMYFQVPQSRERLIFVGVREDLGREPSHPGAESAPVTVREAFNGVQDSVRDRVNPKADSKTLRQMQSVRPGDRCKLHHSHHRLHFEKPSPTVVGGGGASEWHIWYPSQDRPVTRLEARRLASFPDDFCFVGDVSSAFVRIGNSVPPLFMRAIARHVRETILEADMGLEPVLTESKAEKW
jgi:DNA (cytosine-5)-methyltransferase 1